MLYSMKMIQYRNCSLLAKQSITFLLLLFLFGNHCPMWGQDEKADSLAKIKEAEKLENYADSCFDTDDITSALDALSKASEIRKDVQGTYNLEYANDMLGLSICYGTLNNNENAIKYGTKAIEIQKNVLGAEHPDYAKSLSLFAMFNFELNNYIEAVKLETEVVEIQKKVLGAKHPDYAKSLERLAIYNSELGNYVEAIRLGTEAMEIQKKVFGPEHPDYAVSLKLLALCNYELGNNSDAIRLETEAMEIQKKVLGVYHPDYVNSLESLAENNSKLGNNSDAIRLETEAVEIKKNVLGHEHPDYAKSLERLAIYNSELGNYVEAIRLGTEAMEIQKKVLGLEHPDYVGSLSNLSNHYYCLGNYVEAIRLGTEAMEIEKKVFGFEHPHYAITLHNLALYNSKLGNYVESIRLVTEAMEIKKKVFGLEHPEYAGSLNNLALDYSHLGNYEEAVRLGTKAMEILKKNLGIEHPNYARSLVCLAVYNSELGNYVEAIRLVTEAMEIQKKVLGVEHPDYAESLENLAIYNSSLGKYTIAVKNLSMALKIMETKIIRCFSELSSQRRNHFWNQEKYHFLRNLPLMSFKTRSSILIPLVYDKAALFAKGILLNTEMEMKKLIEESGDSSLIEDYQKLLLNYEIYNKQTALPISKRYLDTDSLNQVIQKQEDNLVSKSKAYGDFTRNLRLTWKDVQHALSDEDIAIEFLDFPVGNDSVMYVALTLKKEYDSPRMIPLFELRQLKVINENTYYRSPSLSELIWGPLKEELTDVRNVYFSPSGELHRIGIEYLPLSGEEYVFDKYQMHRLSSTRQIVLDKKQSTRKQAVIYGGIDYDTSLNMALSDKGSSTITQIPVFNMVHVDSLSVRGSREYLEGTKVEADNIAANLKQHRWECNYYSGAEGTEESFKMMSGNSPSLLHIATHGFYMTQEDARIEQELALLESNVLMGDSLHIIREDKPMTRSGLLMSGCNHALNHESIPEDVDDGILTAQEIASLDLRGLDLVVLSACETGLGDIASGEGVFGLQRGFKKAGASTIIMSLWEVSDKATETLMTTFYHHYLNGMTKYDAFTTAREKLRQNCPPRQNRPDWAAFIILDALD